MSAQLLETERAWQLRPIPVRLAKQQEGGTILS